MDMDFVGYREMAKETARRAGFTVTDTQKIIQCFLEVVGDEIESGKKVRLSEIGWLMKERKKPRKRYIPSVEEVREMPGVYMMHFEPSAVLKKRINQ